MDRSKKPKRNRSDPLPEPEYFDELFPPLEDMPDPWSEQEDSGSRPALNQNETNSDAVVKEASSTPIPPPPSAAGKGKVEDSPAGRAAKSVPGDAPRAGVTPEKGENRPIEKRSPEGLPNTNGISRPPTRQNYLQRPSVPRRPLKSQPSVAKSPPPTEPPTQAARARVAISPPKVGVRAGSGEVSKPESTPEAKSEKVLDWPIGGKADSPEKIAGKPQWYVLEEVITSHRPLPDKACILGVGEDGKPLVLSLEEPSPGGILVIGDSARDNRKHLQAILHSISLMNQKEQVHIDVISPETANYKARKGFIEKVIGTEEDNVYDMLGDFLEALEKRGLRESPHPIRILVLDEIDILVSRLAPESLSYLRWILRRGPQVGIWPIASLASGRLTDFDLKTFRSFGLRLCGKITETAIAERYSNISAHLLKKLSPGSQACLKVEDEVITFSIPHF